MLSRKCCYIAQVFHSTEGLVFGLYVPSDNITTFVGQFDTQTHACFLFRGLNKARTVAKDHPRFTCIEFLSGTIDDYIRLKASKYKFTVRRKQV